MIGSWAVNQNSATDAHIARNQVVLNQVFRRIADADTSVVADRNSTSNISANTVADYLVVARTDAGNLDANPGTKSFVARD